MYVLEINLDKLLAKKTGKMKYKEISKFPTVKKDLSIIVDNKVQSSEIATQIKKAAGSLLLNSEVFDLYAGKGIEEGKKSLAFALTFGANDRTLTNQEINDVLEKIVDRLSKIMFNNLIPGIAIVTHGNSAKLAQAHAMAITAAIDDNSIACSGGLVKLSSNTAAANYI